MNRHPFWRDPPAAARPAPVVTTLAHAGGATATDFTRSETRELFLAVTAALKSGAKTKEAVLAALPDHLREHAEWIDAAEPTMPVAEAALLAKQANESVTALRLLNVRRELVELQQAMKDDPTNKDLLRRVGVLVGWMREASRAYPRAEMTSRMALGRETGKLPNRVPVDVLRLRNRRAG